MDRIKYRRMLPVYLADMKDLEGREPSIWESFMQGKFTVKKSSIPFTSLSADHAGEQKNKLEAKVWKSCSFLIICRSKKFVELRWKLI